eukprot:UN22126
MESMFLKPSVNNFAVGPSRPPGWYDCISDSPKLKNHGPQKFISKQYIVFQQNVKVFLKKITPKFE